MIKRFVERFIFTAIMGIMMACTESDGNVFTVVTDENYALAETQVIFADYRDRIAAVSGTGGTGVFLHNTNAADPNDKTVVRINFDTRYSMCLLDLKEDAVLTMPETGGRYQSAWFVTEEHYNPMAITAPGTYTLQRGSADYLLKKFFIKKVLRLIRKFLKVLLRFCRPQKGILAL